MSRIVMIGGHGKVALLAAPLLVEAGHEVVSLIRNPDQADDVVAVGATPLVLSVEEADVAELQARVRLDDVSDSWKLLANFVAVHARD